jgi:hypothetical protein
MGTTSLLGIDNYGFSSTILPAEFHLFANAAAVFTARVIIS